jgi:archaellum component FlaD/FlaE
MLESIARLFGEDRDETDETQADDPVGGADDLEIAPDPPVEEPAGPDTVELSNRIDDLEDEIESTATSLDAIRNAQEETADSVEEVNETVRRLAGIYDQVAAAENPFVGDGGGSSGVVDDGPGDVAGDASTVSFDDLDGDEAASADDPDEADAAVRTDQPTAPPEHNGSASSDHDDASGAAGNGEGEAADPAFGAWEPNETDSGSVPAPESEPERPAAAGEPLVETIPPGYAGDLLVMEWLSQLMDRSGPAGALRAIEHYRDLGLVSETVRDRVVAALGGPSLDVFVDPTKPHEPTIEEHRISNTYLHALRDLED